MATLKLTSPPMEIWIGCSGWFYWHWKGLFYPEQCPTHRWFKHYASKFKTVELNAPFYRWPTPSTVKCWVKQAPKRGFTYCIKVNGLITHEKRFVGTKKLVRDFSAIADALGDRMGCFLFQMPPSYRYTPGRLRAIMSQLDHARRNVIEFRHPSWWNSTVLAACRKHGTIFCSSSGPRMPDELVTTAEDIYLRFHGTKKWYRHDYSSDELAVWADRIRASGAKRAWIYFNNDREGFAIKNARKLKQLLKNPPAVAATPASPPRDNRILSRGVAPTTRTRAVRQPHPNRMRWTDSGVVIRPPKRARAPEAPPSRRVAV